jgi:hypothetical protein
VQTAVSEAGPSGDVVDPALRTVVSVVTFDTAVAEERSMRLIDRLERLAAPGVPRVVDVVVDDARGPAVVLEFCGDSVASILAGGAEITAGEIVTLAAPILTALVALHDRGFAHGDVSVGSIAVGAGGRPLLLGCERAVELPSEHVSAREAATDDLHRFADAVRELGREVRDPNARGRVLANADAIRSGAVTPFSPSFRASAEVRLFEIAEPSPLAFSATAERELVGAGHVSPVRVSAGGLRPRSPERRPGLIDAVEGVLARLRGPFDARSRVAPRAVIGRAQRRDGEGPLERADRGERLASTEKSRLPASRGRRDPRSGSAKSRRGPLIVGATIVAVTIVVLVLVPTGEPTRSTGAADRVPASRENRQPSDPGEMDPATTGSPASPEPGPASSPPAESPDDALDGARAALDGIAGCSAAPDDSCWPSVIEQGTALLAELSAAEDPLSALPAALALPVDAVEITPRDDYGDLRVVLVTPIDETRPASVLMIRTVAGWRVREAFDA